MPNPSNKIDLYLDEKVFIIKNHDKMSAGEILDHLNQYRANKLTKHTLRNKIYELGIKQKRNIPWTKEEEQFLIDNYQTKGNLEICALLNKNRNKSRSFTPKILCKKMILLKISRTQEQLEAIRQNNIKNGSYKYDRYWKKHPEGKITIRKIGLRKYKWIKHQGKMVSLARLIWEQNNGEIPKGFKVQFKDGNGMNCNIENLFIARRGIPVKKKPIERNIIDPDFLARDKAHKSKYIPTTYSVASNF